MYPGKRSRDAEEIEGVESWLTALRRKDITTQHFDIVQPRPEVGSRSSGSYSEKKKRVE